MLLAAAIFASSAILGTAAACASAAGVGAHVPGIDVSARVLEQRYCGDGGDVYTAVVEVSVAIRNKSTRLHLIARELSPPTAIKVAENEQEAAAGRWLLEWNGTELLTEAPGSAHPENAPQCYVSLPAGASTDRIVRSGFFVRQPGSLEVPGTVSAGRCYALVFDLDNRCPWSFGVGHDRCKARLHEETDLMWSGSLGRVKVPVCIPDRPIVSTCDKE